MTELRDSFDSLGKDILEAYFQDCIEFFSPQIYIEIDWSIGYDFLDQELQQVVRDGWHWPVPPILRATNGWQVYPMMPIVTMDKTDETRDLGGDVGGVGSPTGQMLRGVGAGNGSIGIEWLRSHPRNRAMAIEQHLQRQQNLAHNAAALGVPNLEIIAGSAPAALLDLPRPDAIFIGGGLTIPAVFETCWLALKAGDRLVANAVTVEMEQRMFQLYSQYGGTLSHIAIQRAEPVGKFSG